jgi:putative phosphoesterase
VKIAVLADIHGNCDALKAVLNHLPSVDLIIVVGDVLGYYPFFETCIDDLMKVNAVCILGNHEAYQMNLLTRPNDPIIDWFHSFYNTNASERTNDWLVNLKDTYTLKVNGTLLSVFHGSPWGVSEYIYPDHKRWNRFRNVNADIILLGHTHLPMDILWNRKRIINPGSVGQPRDGNPKASYVLYEEDSQQVRFCRVLYDPTRVVETMRDMGCDEEYLTILFRDSNKHPEIRKVCLGN